MLLGQIYFHGYFLKEKKEFVGWKRGARLPTEPPLYHGFQAPSEVVCSIRSDPLSLPCPKPFSSGYHNLDQEALPLSYPTSTGSCESASRLGLDLNQESSCIEVPTVSFRLATS